MCITLQDERPLYQSSSTGLALQSWTPLGQGVGLLVESAVLACSLPPTGVWVWAKQLSSAKGYLQRGSLLKNQRQPTLPAAGDISTSVSRWGSKQWIKGSTLPPSLEGVQGHLMAHGGCDPTSFAQNLSDPVRVGEFGKHVDGLFLWTTEGAWWLETAQLLLTSIKTK